MNYESIILTVLKYIFAVIESLFQCPEFFYLVFISKHTLRIRA